MRIGDRLRVYASELLRLEPPNKWFGAWSTTDQSGNETLHVDMSARFYLDNPTQLDKLWDTFHEGQLTLSEMQKKGNTETTSLEAELSQLSGLSGQIKNICGVSGYDLWHKLTYLREHGGCDEYGRQLPITRV